MQFFMKSFIEPEFFPISLIDDMRKSWVDRSGDKYPAMISLRDGREIKVDDEDIDRILRQSTPITPALPGFELLTFGYLPGDDEPGPWVHREPIIGWRDYPYGGIEPVVLDSDFIGLQARHAILEPSGKLQAGDRSFATEPEWIADMQAEMDADHARALRHAAAPPCGLER